MEKENILKALLEIWEQLPSLIGKDWPNFYIFLEDIFTRIQVTEDIEDKALIIAEFATSFRPYPKAKNRLREILHRLSEEQKITVRSKEETTRSNFDLLTLLGTIRYIFNPSSIIRYLDITVPSTLSLGCQGVITVGLIRSPIIENDTARFLELIPKQLLEIYLVSQQTDIEIMGKQVKPLLVEMDKDTEPVVFFIKGSALGTKEFVLKFCQAGVLIHTVNLLIKVVNKEISNEQINAFTSAIFLSNSFVPPADLDIQITLEKNGRNLKFVLHSPNESAAFHYQEVSGKEITRSPEQYQQYLIEKIEALAVGEDIEGNSLFSNQIEDKLNSIGRLLYEELFSKEMRSAYRKFRKTVKTIQITSEEPWIPWELIKPYDDSDLANIIDDDFLCCQFQLTRWLAGSSGPASRIAVSKVVCIEAGQPPNQASLRYAPAERQYFVDMALNSGIEDASPSLATSVSVYSLLDVGGAGLWHFAAHGNINLLHANESQICLADGVALRAEDIHGPRQTHVTQDRPLVFLNACRVGQQSWSFTRLGGWVATWVDRCRCGAFIAPLWSVDDKLAFEFAKTFYDSLRLGKTIGEAAKNARELVRRLAPNNPTWLAYSIYAHPNARIIFNRN